MRSIGIYDTIASLKQERDAVILAHYYQPLEIQKAADRVGDSFELAKFATGVEKSVIVVCGVRFMAETVKILSPEKTVLLPAPGAGCRMADMISPEEVRKLRKLYPDAAIMCYVNTTAAVKAECDICCTSSSALQAARSLPQHRVIFLPDKNLGAYVKAKVPEKEFILWNGFCPVHNSVSESDLYAAKAEHPHAKVLVHPECREEVCKLADFCGSTSQIIKRVTGSSDKEFIIGTEMGVAERLNMTESEKSLFDPHKQMICPDMKKISLEDIKKSLEENTFKVSMPQEIIVRAHASLKKMMEACS